MRPHLDLTTTLKPWTRFQMTTGWPCLMVNSTTSPAFISMMMNSRSRELTRAPLLTESSLRHAHMKLESKKFRMKMFLIILIGLYMLKWLKKEDCFLKCPVFGKFQRTQRPQDQPVLPVSTSLTDLKMEVVNTEQLL